MTAFLIFVATLTQWAGTQGLSIQPDVIRERATIKKSVRKPLKLMWSIPNGSLQGANERYVIVQRQNVEGSEVVRASSGATIYRFKGGKSRLDGDTLVFATAEDSNRIVGIDLTSGKERFRFEAGAVTSIGPILSAGLVYTDSSGVKLAEIPSGRIVQSRDLSKDMWLLGANENRVFVRWDGHEVMGIDVHDFAHAWRSYCNVADIFVDETGFVGPIWFNSLVRVDMEGKPNSGYSQGESRVYYPMQVDRQGATLLAAGARRWTVGRDTYVDQRVYCLDAVNCGQRWSKAMAAWQLCVFGDRVAIVTRHALRDAKGRIASQKDEVGVEIRAAADGRLLDSPKALQRNAKRIERLAAAGDTLLVVNSGSLSAYR